MDFISAAFGRSLAPKSQRPTFALIQLGIFMSVFSLMAQELSRIMYRLPDAMPPSNSSNEPRPFPYHILQNLSIIFRNAQVPIIHLAFCGLIYARGRSMGAVKPEHRMLRPSVAYRYGFIPALVLSFVTPPILQYVLQWQWTECIPTPSPALINESGSGNLDSISQESIHCTVIWEVFTWTRFICAWVTWYSLVYLDWLFIPIAVEMISAHKTPTEAIKHHSKVVTYTLLLTCGLLLWQSTYINFHPTMRRAMFKPATDITYFDVIGVTRGMFWLIIHFGLLGLLAGYLEWPALTAFEEAQEMAKDVDPIGSLETKDLNPPN